MTVTLYLSCSLGLLNRRPRAHSAGCWLSLLHLISIFSGSQTPSGFPRAPSVGCGFPYHSRLQLRPIFNWLELYTQLYSVQFVGLILPSNSHAEIWTRLHALRNFFRYLAIGMCHFRYFWNGLCDRHRAEITVMQFTGHSLPVRQSMSVP